MQFRQAGSRDRRRRVFQEDASESRAAQSEEETSAEATPSKSYPDEALPERQARVTDLLPVSVWSFVAGITLLALGVASVELLYVFFDRWQEQIGAENLRAFDLNSPANIGGWFSSITFFLASCASVLIFSLRRHRHDDYRGRYRVWLSAAVVFLVASIDTAAGLRRTIGGLVLHFSGAAVAENTSTWTLLACALIALGVTLRLVGEIYRSRAAMCGLALMITAYSVSAGVTLGAAPKLGLVMTGQASLITSSAAAMTGHIAALLTVLLYGRYVMLDAQGKVPARPVQKKVRRKRRKDSAETENEETTVRIDAAHSKRKSTADSKADPGERKIRVDGPQTKTAPANATEKTAGKATYSATISADQLDALDNNEDDDDSEGETGGKKLSKAERRRARKERRSTSA
ncbi:hypothetical protein [Lignipirellula cremea]|uniref:Uncharacterized protein n=1 Tax=Lignipirellula cremea TaxID=2528010 RepID=A0A518DYZ0_9BACT|nr:hypothetical protein [Lignipirellula cremea]QDU97059.1 hypothetical protein Pla8534_48850 [Lignipirellula cremea]